MKILICNVGSTSLKFKLYDMPACTVLVECRVERVGSDGDSIYRYVNLLSGKEIREEKASIPNYRFGIERFLKDVCSVEFGVLKNVKEIERVGYKATLSKGHLGVHRIDAKVLQGMRDWIALAPVHNKGYLEAMELMQEVLPDAVSVGCFETAFHRDIPLARKIYGVPYEWYEKHGVQRLGYHSASHSYIADCLGELQGGKPYKAISCHLGGSCSVCGIENGKSVDTSFGMSLESGLIHAERVGDMDPDLYEFLLSEGLTLEEIHEGFNRNGGLKGISGISGDVRYLAEAAGKGNERAQLALDVFVNGIVHYIGAFYVDLEGLDYLVFTAGIGENSALIRRMVCEKLGVLGVKLDEAANEAVKGRAEISAPDSKVKVLVIPTDEELGIARRTYEY